MKFNACKNLDFNKDNYICNLSSLFNNNQVKPVWERKDLDGVLQLCQFCKLRGRLNHPEACLDITKKMCFDYEDFEHELKE